MNDEPPSLRSPISPLNESTVPHESHPTTKPTIYQRNQFSDEVEEDIIESDKIAFEEDQEILEQLNPDTHLLNSSSLSNKEARSPSQHTIVEVINKNRQHTSPANHASYDNNAESVQQTVTKDQRNIYDSQQKQHHAAHLSFDNSFISEQKPSQLTYQSEVRLLEKNENNQRLHELFTEENENRGCETVAATVSAAATIVHTSHSNRSNNNSNNNNNNSDEKQFHSNNNLQVYQSLDVDRLSEKTPIYAVKSAKMSASVQKEQLKRKAELERQLRELENQISTGSQLESHLNNSKVLADSTNANTVGITAATTTTGLSDQNTNKQKQKLNHHEIFSDRIAQESAARLVKRMAQARRAREQKQMQYMEAVNEKLLIETRESHQRSVEQKEHQTIQKRERIISQIEAIRVRSEERRIQNRTSNHIIKEIKQEVLTNDPVERFRQEFELPELERRKKELAEKRKLFRPIELNELREHARKHDEDIKLRRLQARATSLTSAGTAGTAAINSATIDAAISTIDCMQNILSINSNNISNNCIPKIPKSSIMAKVIQDDKQAKIKEAQEIQKKKEFVERRKEYAKLVKEVHVPKVNNNKVAANIVVNSPAAAVQSIEVDLNETSSSSKLNSNNNNNPRRRSLQVVHNRRSLVLNSRSPDALAGVIDIPASRINVISQANSTRSQRELHADKENIVVTHHETVVEGDSLLERKPQKKIENHPVNRIRSNNQSKEKTKQNLNVNANATTLTKSNRSSQNSIHQSAGQQAGIATNTQVIQKRLKRGGSECFADENSIDESKHSISTIANEDEVLTEQSRGKRNIPKPSGSGSSTIPNDIPKPPQVAGSTATSSIAAAAKKQSTDYIVEMRKQRQEMEKKQGKKVKLEDWEKYKYDPTLSNTEKYSHILQTATRLEHKAKLKELTNSNDPDVQDQANSMYIDSIKAKLALLETLS